MIRMLHAAACCLAMTACILQPGYAAVPRPLKAIHRHAARATATLQLVHDGSTGTIRNITGVTINGVSYPLTGNYTNVVWSTTTTGPNVVTVTYSNITSTDCFYVIAVDQNSTSLYNGTFSGSNTATFTVNLPATSNYLFIEFLDNVGCPH